MGQLHLSVQLNPPSASNNGPSHSLNLADQGSRLCDGGNILE
jgi:hypothetical protein